MNPRAGAGGAVRAPRPTVGDEASPAGTPDATVLFHGTGLPEDHWHDSDEKAGAEALLRGAGTLARLLQDLPGRLSTWNGGGRVAGGPVTAPGPLPAATGAGREREPAGTPPRRPLVRQALTGPAGRRGCRAARVVGECRA